MDSEVEDYDEDRDSEADEERDSEVDEDRNSEAEEDEVEGEEEEIEEKPILMLWAALHAQEERYLQQMQQQLLLQQQQQQQIQQRLEMLQQQQQQRERDLQERADAVSADINAVAMTMGGAPPSTAPTVGSRYHSMISTAISNASMTLWDENRATNQYEQVCR